MQNIQAAIIATITQIVALVVGFGVLNNTEAGLITNAAAAVVATAFVLGNAIEQNAKAHVKAATIAAAK